MDVKWTLDIKKGLRFHVTPCFIWWSWRELNPRPKFLHTILMLVKSIIYVLNQLVGFIWYSSVLCFLKALPPFCRH